MSVLVLLEAKAKPDRVDDLKQLLKDRFPQTRAFQGCRDIIAYTDVDDGRSFVFVEHWDSKDDYGKYFAWRTETGVIAQLVDALDGAPTIRYFETVDA